LPGQSFRGFAEKVALVTNGARGVGRAVAVSLALEGAFVVVSFDPADGEGESAAAELRELGTLAHAFAADVSRAAGVQRLFQSIDETFGRLDLLVNVAPTTGDAVALEALGEGAWDAVVDSALKGAFLCAQGAAPLMRGRPGPAVVNVASEAGLSGRGASAAEVAAHAGLVGLTKALARELGPRVRVNCVAVRPAAADSSTAGAAASEVARACLYLLSSDARSVSGQTLVVGRD
jgi:3-oxoacyl-[acyl-carrier protein] reductase